MLSPLDAALLDAEAAINDRDPRTARVRSLWALLQNPPVTWYQRGRSRSRGRKRDERGQRAITKAYDAAGAARVSPIRAYLAANRLEVRRALETRRRRRALWRLDRPRRNFEQALRAYGLVPEDWARLWEAQGGRCPICRRPLLQDAPRKNGTAAATHEPQFAVVDHDHRTGRVRGLVCQNPCNYRLLAVIDQLRVNPRDLVAYLQEPA